MGNGEWGIGNWELGIEKRMATNHFYPWWEHPILAEILSSPAFSASPASSASSAPLLLII